MKGDGFQAAAHLGPPPRLALVESRDVTWTLKCDAVTLAAEEPSFGLSTNLGPGLKIKINLFFFYL